VRLSGPGYRRVSIIPRLSLSALLPVVQFNRSGSFIVHIIPVAGTDAPGDREQGDGRQYPQNRIHSLIWWYVDRIYRTDEAGWLHANIPHFEGNRHGVFTPIFAPLRSMTKQSSSKVKTSHPILRQRRHRTTPGRTIFNQNVSQNPVEERTFPDL
jgi:hypothetical protein